MLKIKWISIVFFCILFFTNIQAQVVSNIKSAIRGKEIVITYDLQGINSDAICDVTIYFGGESEQSNILVDATGDFGVNVKVGNQKTIRISNVEPFLPYMTGLVFSGVAEYTFIPITDFISLRGEKFKVGSTIPLTWSGGVKASPVTISLYKDSKFISEPSKLSNNNKYGFALPKAAKKGSEYEFMLEDAIGSTFYTGKFSLKPKMNGAVKVVISVAIIGGGVYLLTQNGGQTPTDSPDGTGIPDLPDGAHPAE